MHAEKSRIDIDVQKPSHTDSDTPWRLQIHRECFWTHSPIIISLNKVFKLISRIDNDECMSLQGIIHSLRVMNFHKRWLSCNPCYNNLFRRPFAVKAETLQSHEKDWAWPWHALAMFLPTVFLTCAAKNKKAELRNSSDNEKLLPTTSWSQPIAASHSQSRDAHDTRLKPLL